ncbi:MAG: hypothetical protein AAGA93_28055, partial [Actinomycetota bacterium]
PDVVVVEAQGSPTCSVDVDGTGRQGIVVGRATGLCVVTIRVSGEGYAEATATDRVDVVDPEGNG